MQQTLNAALARQQELEREARAQHLRFGHRDRGARARLRVDGMRRDGIERMARVAQHFLRGMQIDLQAADIGNDVGVVGRARHARVDPGPRMPAHESHGFGHRRLANAEIDRCLNQL